MTDERKQQMNKQAGENMTPKQVNILQAAIQLFAKQGYYNTSTNEIAKLAGVAEGTIFRHYPTKKALLEAALAPALIEMTATYFGEQFIEDAVHMSHRNLHAFLEAFIRNRYTFAAENTPVLKILLQELAFHPDVQATFKNVFKTKMYPQLSKVLSYYKEQGELKDIAIPDMIRMMVPAIIGLLVNRFILQPDKEHDDEAEIQQTIDFIMHGLAE